MNIPGRFPHTDVLTSAHRRRRPRRRRRVPGRPGHPQAAAQDRRQDDPRAHPRRVPGRARDRRDRRADGGGHLDAMRAGWPRRTARSARSRAAAAPATRRRTPPCRARARSATTTARCSSTTRCARCSTTGSSPSASRRWAATTPSTSRSRRPTRSSWSTSDDEITDIPDRCRIRARPDPAGVPPLHDPPRLRAGRAGPGLHRHRRLQRGAALPARRADLGGRTATSRT